MRSHSHSYSFFRLLRPIVVLLVSIWQPRAVGLTNKYGSFEFTVPNGYNEKHGPQTSLLPYDHAGPLPMHYQQVFDASQFKELPQGGGFIISMADRAACRSVNGFFATNAIIRLSTSQAKPDQMSSNYVENVGFDQITVSSTKSLFVMGYGLDCFTRPGGPSSYDIMTPFFYDPAKGNLLLDLTFTSTGPRVPGGDPRKRDSVAQADDSVSSIAALSLDRAAADVVSTEGLIVEFLVVPTPEIRVTHATNTVVVNWPFNTPNVFKFQATENLEDPSGWQDGGGDIKNLGLKGYTVFLPDNSLNRRRFFRLYWNSPQPGVPSPKARVVTPAELEQTQ
ncbi:MAG: hypothetical protein HYR88_06095 [Verrucomicrobia bacterium]|nr:hypothetical protein [Verrucomicrobiota bacterium]MBI3868448.1 hypothetical protein [Verrucomicrobiota bacterium]